MAEFPYADRFPINRTLPEQGRPREEVLAELRAMADLEDDTWETGKVSGTMYCGDHDHYAFMNEAFGLYAHVNVLQRDICPSATKFEAEILGMALDLFHADAVTDGSPAGLTTTGGTGSILHAVLVLPRARGRHPWCQGPQLRDARDRPPGLHQGLPPLRRRAPRGAHRPRHHPGPTSMPSPT